MAKADFTTVIKERIEVLLGERGNKADSAVRHRDIAALTAPSKTAPLSRAQVEQLAREASAEAMARTLDAAVVAAVRNLPASTFNTISASALASLRARMQDEVNSAANQAYGQVLAIREQLLSSDEMLADLSDAIDAVADASAPRLRPVVTRTGLSHTIVSGDIGSYVRLDLHLGADVVIPDNASLDVPIGAQIEMFAAGGRSRIVPASGVTLRASGNNMPRWSTVTLTKVGTDAWDIRGGTPDGPSFTDQVRDTLFAGGVPGGMWDMTRIDTLWQDAAGTIPLTAYGDPIGRVPDISGNGTHLVQADAPNRPGFDRHGAVFDGVDDFFNSIDLLDLSATGELVVCAALDRPSPSAGRIIVETTTNSSLNTGSIALFNGGSVGLGFDRFRSRGTSGGAPVGFAAPGPNRAIISCMGRITPAVRVMRRNGVEGVNSTSSQGTGTYGSWPLYIGSRGGVSEFFSGSIARLVICGRLPSPEETALIEAWCDEPLGVL